MFSNPEFRVFDIHGHLPYKLLLSPHKLHESVSNYGKERSERMRLSWDFPAPEETAGEAAKPLIERWVDELDKYKIGGLNFLTAHDNDKLAEQIAGYPDRFTGFACHPIESEDAASELERAVDELGLRGYKLFGPLTPIPFDSPSLDPVWKFLAERRLPVLIHFGMLGHAGGSCIIPTSTRWRFSIRLGLTRTFPSSFLILGRVISRSCCIYAGAVPTYISTRQAPTNGCGGCRMS